MFNSRLLPSFIAEAEKEILFYEKGMFPSFIVGEETN